MEKTILPFQDLRDQLGERIATLGVTKAGDYAQFIRGNDPSGPAPCWGAIAKRFEDDFPTDDDRLALLKTLLEQPDRRVLTLFVQRNRGRKGVMAAVTKQLDLLPPVLQQGVVAILPANEITEEVRPRLDPAARELLGADDAAKAREAEQFEIKAKKLMAFDYFVADTGAAGVEPT